MVRLFAVRDKVEAVLKDVLLPLFEADGGHIELVDVKDGKVVVRLGAAYTGCPSSTYTLESVIRPAIRNAVGDTELQVELVP